MKRFTKIYIYLFFFWGGRGGRYIQVLFIMLILSIQSFDFVQKKFFFYFILGKLLYMKYIIYIRVYTWFYIKKKKNFFIYIFHIIYSGVI